MLFGDHKKQLQGNITQEGHKYDVGHGSREVDLNNSGCEKEWHVVIKHRRIG